MTAGRMGSSGCLAWLSSRAVVGRDLERLVSFSLRATDVVARRGNDVVAVIAGGADAAGMALGRAVSRDPDIDLTVRFVPDDDPAFEQLAAELAVAGPTARPRVPSAADPQRPAILVVIDDEAEVLAMFTQLVSLQDWTVVAADSRTDAVELCLSSPADVLVTDYYLRWGVTGVDVAKACRRAGLGIPIVVFTASSWASVAEDAIDVGAIVVSKGDIDGLLSNLDRLADRLRRSHRRRRDQQMT